MNDDVDDEIEDIIARYVREVREEKMRAKWANVFYAHEQFEERRCIWSSER